MSRVISSERGSPKRAASAAIAVQSSSASTHLAADRARQREHRRVREREPDRAVLARLGDAQAEVVARALHAAALVERIADAAEGARLVHRRAGAPRPGERALVRHQAGLELAAREVDVAAQPPDARQQLRPIEARQHRLGALERRERLVVAVEDPERIREREPRARLDQRLGPKVDHLAQRRDRVVRVPGAGLQLAEQAAREAQVRRLAREQAGAAGELERAVEPQRFRLGRGRLDAGARRAGVAGFREVAGAQPRVAPGVPGGGHRRAVRGGATSGASRTPPRASAHVRTRSRRPRASAGLPRPADRARRPTRPAWPRAPRAGSAGRGRTPRAASADPRGRASRRARGRAPAPTPASPSRRRRPRAAAGRGTAGDPARGGCSHRRSRRAAACSSPRARAIPRR